MKSRVKILVCCHKPGEWLNDDIYMPIQCGKAISNVNLGIQGDDTGDNISSKNRNYCELTALYWAWKNLNEVDYIGFCHYRRYFDIDENKIRDIEKLIKKNDIIVINPAVLPDSVAHRLAWAVCLEDLYILLMLIEKLYPEYKSTLVSFFYNSNKYFPYQMFICSWRVFTDYSNFVFSILFEVEKYIKMSEYTRMKRSLAYMGELLLSLYCLHNNLKIKKMSAIITDSKPTKKWRLEFGNIRRNIAFLLMHTKKNKKINYDDNSITIGLKEDNLLQI